MQVTRRTTVPLSLSAIVIVTAVATLLGLINIGSSTAFNDVVSLVLQSFDTSYSMAISKLLYRIVDSQIAPF